MTSLRHHIASLLVGFDVERVREQRDCAAALLSRVSSADEITVALFDDVDDFLDTLPIGAVDAARARIARRAS